MRTILASLLRSTRGAACTTSIPAVGQKPIGPYPFNGARRRGQAPARGQASAERACGHRHAAPLLPLAWILLAALLPAQTEARLTLADGRSVDLPAAGAAGLTITNHSATDPMPFRSLLGRYDPGTAPLIPGARPIGPWQGGTLWWVIPEGDHVLYPGERLYVPCRFPELPKPAGVSRDAADARAPPDTLSGPARARALLEARYDLSLLDRWPRLRHVVREFYTWAPDVLVWSQFPSPSPRRQDWLQHHLQRRYAPSQPKLRGWRFGTAEPWGGVSFSNGHYDQGIPWAINALAGDDAAFRVGWLHQVARASMGLRWSGPNRGEWCSEKGIGARGMDSNGRILSNRAKQWDGQAWVWWLLTGDPVIREALEERWAAIRSEPLWDGSWGARIAARTLDSVQWRLDVTGEPAARAELRRRVEAVFALPGQDVSTRLWPNRGNGGRAATSPWMLAQLLLQLWIAGEHLDYPVAGFASRAALEADLLGRMEALHRLGCYRVGPYLATRYRIPGWGQHNDRTDSLHPSASAWMRPLYAILAARKGGRWTEELAACELTTFGRAGCGWSTIDAPVPLESFWYDDPQGGPGGSKAKLAIVRGMLTAPLN